MSKELKTTGLLTPEETLDWHVQDSSDSFDANYRDDVIEAIKSYHLQFERGIIPIPSEPKTDNSGVQKCIDHVLNKARIIGAAKGADHALATMLKTVAKEFEQFL